MKIFTAAICSILIYRAGFCQDSLALQVAVKNVVVPQNEIALDSVSANRYFYSGIVRFDIESPMDSVGLHVFLEEVPFQQYRIMNGMGEDTLRGNARFRVIDNLCTGDLGLLRPKRNCIVNWRFATMNQKNHCRIKIGLGNYCYANTNIETINPRGIASSRQHFEYNNLGLLSKRTDSISYDPPISVKIPQYSNGGQVLVDDTTDPFVTNAYDDQGRAVFRAEANSNGLLVNFIFGYVYDSLSRAIQRQSLPFGATPSHPGTPSSIEFIAYDNWDRISSYESIFAFDRFVCANPYTSIAGRMTDTFFYGPNTSLLVDSAVRDYYDESRQYRLVAKIAEHFSYLPIGLLQEDRSVSKGYDDSGTCWGPQFYQEQKGLYSYDSLSHLYRVDGWQRASIDSLFAPQGSPICSRREYDIQGNTVNQYEFCDQNERLLFKAKYNAYNFITEMTSYGVDTTTTNYQWELLDLDKQNDFLHE